MSRRVDNIQYFSSEKKNRNEMFFFTIFFLYDFIKGSKIRFSQETLSHINAIERFL